MNTAITTFNAFLSEMALHLNVCLFVPNGITYLCGIDVHLSSRPAWVFLMISDNTKFKMPVCWKKFNALEVPNLLTDYDPDFCVNFLDEIASKIGVCPAVFTATLIMARVPVVNSTFSQSTKPCEFSQFAFAKVYPR